MSHSVEGRYPFLDRQVQEFLGQVPPTFKTRWHAEKILLREAMKDRLPEDVVRTQKKPFLAPFGTPFIGKDATDELRELLSPRLIAEYGYFDPGKVQRIVDYLTEAKSAIAQDEGESLRPGREAVQRVLMGMALTFVASTQTLESHVRRGSYA